MKFEGTKIFGLENALIGMRLPMSRDYEDAISKCDSKDGVLGEKDLRVMKSLVNGDDSAGHGQPNSKFMRMIHVQVAITAPLAWWKEMDTYKVGTTANSSSTMHRIQTYPITEDCFEKNPITNKISSLIDIDKLEELRRKYNIYSEILKEASKPDFKPQDFFMTKEEYIESTKKEQKAVWYDLIYGLGDSWLQTRMFDCDYATLHSMYYWRKNHKQNCWSGKDNPNVDYFCKWVESLPYAKELICVEEGSEK